MSDEANNINSLLKNPIPEKPSRVPVKSTPDFSGNLPGNIPVSGAVPGMEPEKKTSGLINFSDDKIVRNDSIYDKTFKFKTKQALKDIGTLKHDVDARRIVSDMLWSKRGYGGITNQEAKTGLKKLEKSGDLSHIQVKAIRRKMGISKSSIF